MVRIDYCLVRRFNSSFIVTYEMFEENKTLNKMVEECFFKLSSYFSINASELSSILSLRLIVLKDYTSIQTTHFRILINPSYNEKKRTQSKELC